MSNLPKRVRREDADWPSPEEMDRQLSDLIYSGKPPFENWRPSYDLNQAMQMAQEFVAAREWNIDVTWRSLIWDRPIMEWEARISCLNTEAARIHDVKNAVESYWAVGKTASIVICRVLLNVLDGVTEDEYSVREDDLGEE